MHVRFSMWWAHFSAGGTGRKVTVYECVPEGSGLQ